MSTEYCPLCWSPLEIRWVTPCHVCGGWPEVVERFTPAKEFIRWRLPDGRTIDLCQVCLMQEFMVPGGDGERLGFDGCGMPFDGLHPVCTIPSPALTKDKYCPNCERRLALLKLIDATAVEPED